MRAFSFFHRRSIETVDTINCVNDAIFLADTSLSITEYEWYAKKQVSRGVEVI